MRINLMLLSLAAALASALSGCAGYTASLNPDANSDGKDAYLYGRFSIKSDKIALAMDGYRTIGMAISCQDGKKYTIRFSRDVPLQVIRIRPSVCTLTEFVFSDPDGGVAGRKPAPEGLMKDARFAAGTASYLGDFYANVNTWSTRSLPNPTFTADWHIREVRHDYAQTTAEFRKTYGKLAAVATEDRMIGGITGAWKR